MSCDKGKFWLGLGLGAAIGAVAYHYSRTARAQKMKADLLTSLQEIEVAAEEAFGNAKQKTKDSGAKVAGKVAEKALELQERLKEHDL